MGRRPCPRESSQTQRTWRMTRGFILAGPPSRREDLMQGLCHPGSSTGPGRRADHKWTGSLRNRRLIHLTSSCSFWPCFFSRGLSFVQGARVRPLWQLGIQWRSERRRLQLIVSSRLHHRHQQPHRMHGSALWAGVVMVFRGAHPQALRPCNHLQHHWWRQWQLHSSKTTACC